MKKKILLLVLSTLGYSFAQNVNIPDANFKNALLAHGTTIIGANIFKIDTNEDGEIQISEAEAYSYTIKVTNKNISDLTGIEAFVNLSNLECNLNQLTSLNVSNNTALEFLNCNYNQITDLDVSQNTSLMFLYCKFNLLTSLDVSSNLSLFYLYCDVNEITSLDLTNNTDLGLLSCTNNELTSLNIANGKNWKLNDFYAINNPNLSCIQIDNLPHSSWEKDATASYSTNCALNTNEFNFSDLVTMYPNPVKDFLKIESNETLLLKSYSILDLNGRVLVKESKDFQNNSIFISDLARGIYIIRLETDKGIFVKQIVKE